MDKLRNELPKRIDKAIQWLEESRSSWKSKTIKSKYELQKQKIAVKRARASRDLLNKKLSEEKVSHCRAQEELAQKEIEIADLKSRLEKADQQIEELKKNDWSH
ncbi:hypothetical protein [Candidatus Neptunochlamydia vexilliferae]|uniref:hypothetical protein n=1 Tax=Candidatus Neptunichlamydia vexilliferae TaxID=1651774 RepID=UPI0018916766|nr:hypothetical protein [Candidatus Neptunochlamydia vexilliferae]